jgi:hypothetical protein
LEVFENFNGIPNTGATLFRVGEEVVLGTYKRKEGFIGFKGHWELISVHRIIERYVMCVIFNFTEEGVITLDIQKCL